MIKYLVMDVDGTLTDGKIYMSANGELIKAFDTKDGCGIKDILPQYEIKPIIITGRESQILKKRCEELCIIEVHQGVKDKLGLLKIIVKDLGQCAYIGDDITDIPCMKSIKDAGGYIGCPQNAVKKVVNIADFVSEHNGGDGAVRDFIEWIIEN